MDSLTQRLWEMLQSLRVCDLLCVGSHLSSFCSSRCCGRLWPGQSLRSSWCCSPWPGRSWLLGPCVCTGTEIHNSGDGENHNSEKAFTRNDLKTLTLAAQAAGLRDAANANTSNWVEIPHMPYHVCVCVSRFCASTRMCSHVHGFVYMWDCRLCHIPTVRASVRLIWANMAVPPLWKLHSSAVQRGFCHEEGMRESRDWAEGGVVSGKCF